MTRMMTDPRPAMAARAAQPTTKVVLDVAEGVALTLFPQMPTSSVTLTLPFPPGANHYKRHVCLKDRDHRVSAYLTAEAKEYIKAVQDIVDEAGNPSLEGPGYCISLNIYRPSRRWDCDGTYKLVFDCLQRAGVIKNDNRIIEQHTNVYTVKPAEARVEVLIENRSKW